MLDCLSSAHLLVHSSPVCMEEIMFCFTGKPVLHVYVGIIV